MALQRVAALIGARLYFVMEMKRGAGRASECTHLWCLLICMEPLSASFLHCGHHRDGAEEWSRVCVLGSAAWAVLHCGSVQACS